MENGTVRLSKESITLRRLTVLYKDHGVGRQKELLAHAVRLRILACRNDLNRKRIVSLQLTADSFYLLTAFLTTVTDSSLSLRMTPYHGCYFIGRPESG